MNEIATCVGGCHSGDMLEFVLVETCINLRQNDPVDARLMRNAVDEASKDPAKLCDQQRRWD